MQIISNIALISINETLIVQLISFLIFLFIIHRVMIRPLRDTMAERDQYIESIRQDTIDSQKELEDIVARSAREEDEMRQTAMQMVSEMERLGSREAKSLIGQAKDEITALKKQSQDEIDRQIAGVMTSMQREAQTLSIHIMEKILKRKVTP